MCTCTYSYVLLYGHLIIWDTAELLVPVPGDVQIPERPPQLSSLLTEMSVSRL